MTRFSNFTDEELYAMEIAFCNEALGLLVDEIRTERRLREDRFDRTLAGNRPVFYN